MHLQTLLPAILFAQSSFAYYCCFEIGNLGSDKHYNKVMLSGGVESWYPQTNCGVAVVKNGDGCAAWTSRIFFGSCIGLVPIGKRGVVPWDRCRNLPP
ncbi:hypothetical protein EG328_005063 [Venturia inaequalis]|uniref:Secreted protein n=1 Tax=Venturia inaequalis TaxID=5025 RepID=A0A8H3YXA1_VENIN|nr:hypothetical protein EG328_005063 [Venturia inaequalis]